MKSINIVRNGQITNSVTFETQEELDTWYSYHQESFGEHEVQDNSDQLEQEKQRQEALAYLIATDWIVIRAMERGIELSPEFKAERDAARAKI